jgi:hypothetical protein
MSARGQGLRSDSPGGATSEASSRLDRRARGFTGARRRVRCRSHRLDARGVELELDRRTLERLAGRAVSTTLGPMRPHLVRPARPVGDAAVKRLYRQPTLSAPADQRVEAPAEPIHLDDVTRPDSLESHRCQAYAQARRFPRRLPRSRPPLSPNHRDRSTDVRGSTEQPSRLISVQPGGGQGGTRGPDRIFGAARFTRAASRSAARWILEGGRPASASRLESMKVRFAVGPHAGSLARAEIVAFAKSLEHAGFDGLWLSDLPVAPCSTRCSAWPSPPGEPAGCI